MFNLTHLALVGPLNVAHVAFHITEVNTTSTSDTSSSMTMGGGPLLLILVPFAVIFSTFTTYLMIKRIYFPPDELQGGRRVNGRSPSNYLYGNWQYIEELPTAEIENVCPICFSSLFPEPSQTNTIDKTSSQKSSSASRKLDKVVVSMNPMNAERLIEEQSSYSPLGSPKSLSSPNVNINANTTTNTQESSIGSPPLSPNQMISLIQSSIQVEGPVVMLPCRHYYHETCIKEWCNNHGDCPVCRYKPPNPNATSTDNTSSVPQLGATGITGIYTSAVAQNTTSTGVHSQTPDINYASPAFYSLYRGNM